MNLEMKVGQGASSVFKEVLSEITAFEIDVLKDLKSALTLLTGSLCSLTCNPHFLHHTAPTR